MNEYIYYEACPICDSRQADVLRVIDCTGHNRYVSALSGELVWLKCRHCQHEFRQGYYTDQAWALFNTTPESQQVGKNFHHDRVVSAEIIDRVKRYQDHGLWLDVGFGNGALLLTAQEYDYDVLGIEVNSGSAEILSNLGVATRAGNFETMEIAVNSNIISLCDVLEHTQYPIKVLKKVFDILQPGGILVLSMPNRDSAAWKLQTLEGDISYWHELTHFHNFGRADLYRILKSLKFEVIEYGISKRYKSCMELVIRKPRGFLI